MRRLLLGLTGGMASGKSTVARLLAEEGFTVVDADRLVAELYSPGEAGSQAVAELFGESYLRADGGVDHPKLARLVFSDQRARQRLEAAIHPLVRGRFRDLAAATDGIVVLEATLLVEAGYGEDFDLVLTVEAPEALRLERAVARGMEPAEARARLTAQGDGARRRQGADREIVNDGGLEDLERAVSALAVELRSRLSEG